MTRQLTSPSAGDTVVGNLSAYEGGTGAVLSALARSAMGALPKGSAGVAGQYAVLDSQGKIPVASIGDNGPAPISVKGDKSVLINTAVTYTITNHDIFTNYILEALGGTVRRVGDKIEYSAGATPGVFGFKINGRLVPVEIIGIRPNAPTISAIDIGSGSDGAAASCTGSPFAMNVGNNTHLASDWQVAQDENFTNIVSQSSSDTSNKTTWVSSKLAFSSQYYVRARYIDSTGTPGPWSNVVAITTKSSYIISIEEVLLTDPQKAANYQFGISVTISGDGNRIAVGSPGAESSAGRVLVFRNEGNLWTLEQTIVANDKTSNRSFGYNVSMSDNGSVMAIASTGNASIYIFERSGTTWTQVRVVQPSSSTASIMGRGLEISGDGTRIAVSGNTGDGAIYIYVKNPGFAWAFEVKLVTAYPDVGFVRTCGINYDGTRAIFVSYYSGSGSGYNQANTRTHVSIYVRNGTTWTEETRLLSPDNWDSSNGTGGLIYGAISGDGERVVVGLPAYTGNTGGRQGRIYVFKRTNSSWSLEATIEPAVPVSGLLFGMVFTISRDGSKIAVGCNTGTKPGTTPSGAGCVYTFGRTGAVWKQETVLAASNAKGNNYFGDSLELSADGKKLAVGSYNTPDGSATAVGSAHGFR